MLKFYSSVRSCAILLFSTLFSLSAFSATFTVTNTNSSGAGSLAQAVADANGNPGPDDIVFNIPTDQQCIINLTAPLVITQPLTINGYSQPGAAAGTIAGRTIRINLNAAGTSGNAITVNADNVTISGLAIYNAIGVGIQGLAPGAVAVDNLHVWGNYIGTDSTGLATGLGNASGGVEVNINFGSTVAATNVFIGTNGDGTGDANEGNLVVGSSSGSGINADGILLWRCEDSKVSGNIVGLNKNGVGTGTGATGFGNNRDGIVATVFCQRVLIGTDGNGTSDNVEGNLIGNNGRYGIFLAGVSSTNIIAGNTVGVNSADVAAPNVYGLVLLNAFSNRIGTNADGVSDALEKNVFSGNTTGGVRFASEGFLGFDASTNDNTVMGNVIGANASLSVNIPNTGDGIELQATDAGFAVSNNYFGTNHDGVNDVVERNIILNNTVSGIKVLEPTGGASCTGNKFAGNYIYNNTILGIDLVGGFQPSGVNVNDNGDVDAGANDLLNAPVLATVNLVGSNLVIEGFASPNAVIEFYIPDGMLHPNNPLPGGFTRSFGQGAVFVFRAQEGGTLNGFADNDATTGTYDQTVEGAGSGGTRTENKFSFTVPLAGLPVAITSTTKFSAIAYENASGAGSTSEFSGVLGFVSLPVNFVSFTGRIKDGKSYLNWKTAEEENNSHFEVQKSANGADYVTIGKVQPKGGVTNSYDFTDEAPGAGINYYRIKQVDFDGRPTLSKVLLLRSNLEQLAVKAGPNPFAGSLNIFFKLQKEEYLQIRLYDQGGRLLKSYSMRAGAGVNTYVIGDLQHLPKGQYTLELAGETVKHHQQVIKQ
ncbi:hypothetical protein [Paraflavitalea sp. CAU 1676]|uniref:hypothetical protein n=1 Tax=Paraflavitalea sp. CAU 1676 TaxID=3032598 RepID=UPI0023DCE824|nr:hypothetical protein [Paraflavitalea sp. CAU 1676]MDF2188842.1 hypothetical protein [Paraflavitalea sp. CAU 1676]